MVIDKILKVNTSQDPKVDELKQRLTALQQKAQAVPPAPQPEQLSSQPAQTSSTAQPKLDANVQAIAPAVQPELKLREERTTNLIMNQIKELITLHTEASRRLKDAEAKQMQFEKDIENIKDKHEEMLQKMNTIDSRLEKFMGLYELVTNQYNPFTDSKSFSARSFPIAPQATPVPQTLKPQDTLVKVEDNLTKQTATVQLSKQDQERAHQSFKHVEELMVDLQQKHDEKTSGNVQSEIHALLAGFEQRLQSYIDKSLQEKLHKGFNDLEQGLQQELRDALHAEIQAVQQDDREIQDALNELQMLLQASEAKNRQPVEEELSELTKEISRLQQETKTLPPNMYFRVVDGTILKDLADLRNACRTMQQEVFGKHCSANRHDFADWIEHALLMPELAKLARQSKTPQELFSVITSHDGQPDN